MHSRIDLTEVSGPVVASTPTPNAFDKRRRQTSETRHTVDGLHGFLYSLYLLVSLVCARRQITTFRLPCFIIPLFEPSTDHQRRSSFLLHSTSRHLSRKPPCCISSPSSALRFARFPIPFVCSSSGLGDASSVQTSLLPPLKLYCRPCIPLRPSLIVCRFIRVRCLCFACVRVTVYLMTEACVLACVFCVSSL